VVNAVIGENVIGNAAVSKKNLRAIQESLTNERSTSGRVYIEISRIPAFSVG
jgi:hypothetical protein